METKDGTIVTLQIEQGEKYNAKTGDGAVAFLSTGRRSSIVFAPRGALPGKPARVKLVVLKDGASGEPRLDRAGQPMYRSVPAPVEYVDRWRDNNDGSASRVTYSVNWLFQESEEGVCETRPLAKRERPSHTTTAWRAVWGQSLVDSYLERANTNVIALEAETVQNGSIVWAKTSERPELQPAEMILISGWSLWGGSWVQKHLEPVYAADLTVQLSVKYTESGSEQSVSVNDTWGSLPAWLQGQLSAPYPLCGCGRSRSEKQSDGYAQCERCRTEEKCSRCGNEPVKVAVVAGVYVCAACQPKAGLEAIAEGQFPPARRAELAAEAKQLLTGRALPREIGEAWLAACADHVGEGIRRAQLLERMSGFGWYYLLEGGVFASKFSPEALEILQHFERASGNGLVELAGWLAWGDYYEKSQVQGESPSLNFSVSSFTPGLTLAQKIRGSEAERQVALAAYQRLVVELGEDAPETKAVAEILGAEAQDYAAATAKALAGEDIIGQKARGEVLVDFSVYHRRGGMSGCGDAWVIRPDGTLRDPDIRDVPRHKHDGRYSWQLVASEELALIWSLGSGHDVAGTSDCKVAKLPARGATPDQLRKVGEIELELGVTPGAFGLDPLLARELAAKLSAVRLVHNRLPTDLRHAEGQESGWTFAAISSKSGVTLRSSDRDQPGGDFTRRINHAAPFAEHCDGREAQAVYSVACLGGKLECLAYYKYGAWQIALRWREITEAEQAAPPAPGPPVSAAAPAADLSRVDLSKLFGGGELGAGGGRAKVKRKK